MPAARTITPITLPTLDRKQVITVPFYSQFLSVEMIDGNLTLYVIHQEDELAKQSILVSVVPVLTSILHDVGVTHLGNVTYDEGGVPVRAAVFVKLAQ